MLNQDYRSLLMETNLSQVLPQIYDLRRRFHLYPEIAFEEYRTTDLIRESVESWGLKLQPFKGLNTGGFCDVGHGRAVAFRSDIDALPVTENSDHKICSKVPGMMHACGHDFHTAIGLGLLRFFSLFPDRLPGRLRVIFQPGEEAAPGGAEFVVKEDIWSEVGAILTVHVDANTRPGHFLLFRGPVQASSTSVRIELRGPGGHTSRAFESVDMINAAGQFVVGLQNYVRAHIDPRQTVSFAFGSINGGQSHNIIPQTVTLSGTIRTFDNSVTSNVQRLIESFSRDFGDLHGIRIKANFPTSCPATINDPQLSATFYEFMKSSGRSGNVSLPARPSLGADDFAFYLEKTAGLYLLSGGAGRGNLHSGDLYLSEDLLPATLECLTEFIPALLR